MANLWENVFLVKKG